MIEILKSKISDTIYEKQKLKEELYEKISYIENELFDLNETLIKLNEEDAFFKMSPYEAFNILDKLGYSNEKEKYDLYFSLVSKKDIKVDKTKEKVIERNVEVKDVKLEEKTNIVEEAINTYNSYEDKIEECKKELTNEQRKTLGKLVELLIEEFYDDDFYYYISGVKVSKFRVYYNLSILLSDTYKKEELYDILKVAFTYKTTISDNKDKVIKGLEKVKDKVNGLF